MIEKLIKIILAVLFFICVADLPHGYYQVVRLIALVGFAYLSYQSYESNDKGFAFIFATLAVLFQPILKFH